MRKFIVIGAHGLANIDADCCLEDKGTLSFIENHRHICQFKEWDYWYEKDQEEQKENCDTAKSCCKNGCKTVCG